MEDRFEELRSENLMSNLQTYYRSVGELSSRGCFASLKDVNAFIDFSPEKVRTFERNPHLNTKIDTVLEF